MVDVKATQRTAGQTPADRTSEIKKLFEEMKDNLFECALELTKEDRADWQKAEDIFKLAKNTDALRLSFISLMEGDKPELEGRNTQLLSVVATARPLRRGAKTLDTSASKPGKKKKNEYPKYSVRRDLLIKTGLSRDRRTEYEHVVPHKEFERIIERLAEFSKSKRHFTAEDIQNTLDCPNYQTYIVLALMKSKGLLIIPRRGQYGFKGAKTFASDAATIWTELKS